MKILNVIPRYSPAIGGAETWCNWLCRFLVKKGIVTEVATMNLYNVAAAFDKNFVEEEFISLGKEDYDDGVFIRRYSLWRPWSKSLSARIVSFLLHKLRLRKTQIGDIFATSPHSFQMYKHLFSRIKNTDIVILHTFPYFHILVGYIIAKIYRKIIIIVPHFHPGHVQFERKIFFKIMNNCNAVIAVSDYEKDYLVSKNVNASKVFVSGNAIDIEKVEIKDNFEKDLFSRYKINPNSKKIIFIGRKEIYKGIFTLIDAVNKLCRETKMDICLFLVGPDTPDFDRMYPAIDKADQFKIINFGVTSNEEKENLLAISDVLVLPSGFEAFGIVFLEAWKYGKPVIGINCGAVPKVIGDAGLCAEYGDIDDLKDKIKKIIFDPKLSEEMGLRGREKVLNNYTVEKIYSKVVDAFASIGVKRKKVLIVSQLFPPHYIGGSELAAYEQSKMLRKMGWEVRVVSGKIDNSIKRYSVTKEKGEFEGIRINLHDKDFYHDKYINFDREPLQEIFRKELYSYAPDVVHLHNIYGLSLGMIDECYKMNIPIVMTLHDYWGICPKNLLINEEGSICTIKDGFCIKCQGQIFAENGNSYSFYERNLKYLDYYKKIDLLISPSRYLADRFIERGLPKDKFKIVKYGININRFKEKQPKVKFKKIRLGFVGQTVWHKGLDIFLCALSLLEKEERDKISVLIAGSGDKTYELHCKSLVKEFNFVNFLGKISNDKMHKIYRQIDILIVPSRWPDNSPLVVQEALACGIPIIASDIGGMPELVEDGINGYLFKYNSHEALAQKIREFIKNPDKILQMRLNCLKKAEDNDLAAQVKIVADHYDDVIRGNSKAIKKSISYPRNFEIETTTLCNMNPPCVMCPRSAYEDIPKHKFISPEVIKKIEPLFKTARVASLHGCGEPLMNEELFSFMKLFPLDTTICFNTNGVLLLEKNIRKLIDYKVNSINVSIDAANPQTYKKIRRNDFFNIIKKNLIMLSQMKKKYSTEFPRVIVNMTIMKENASEIVDFARLAKEVDAYGIYLNLLNKIDRNYTVSTDLFHFDYEAQMIDTSAIDFINNMQKVKDLSEKNGIILQLDHIDILSRLKNIEPKENAVNTAKSYFCAKPWEDVLLNINGDVRICCHMQQDKGVIGSLKHETFDEIWNNKKITNIRNAILGGKFPKECIDCKVRQPRLPIEVEYSANLKILDKVNCVNGNIKFILEITNTGKATWSKVSDSIKDRLKVGCRIFEKNRYSPQSNFKTIELRNELPGYIKQGDKINSEFLIGAKYIESGNFKLKFDMVYEFKFWFEDIGSQPLIFNFR